MDAVTIIVTADHAILKSADLTSTSRNAGDFVGYRITALKPGATLTYTVATPPAALAKAHELRGLGMALHIVDPDGTTIDEIDLEERIDAEQAS